MFEENENVTPVYPYEYDHLRFYKESDYDEGESIQDTLKEDLYNHETYKYY